MLNALRHQRFDHIGDRIGILAAAQMCSTPYGIRGLITEWQNQIVYQNVGRCSTPYGIRGLITRGKGTESVAPIVECSTPYGIRGLITFSMRIRQGNGNVLNALRHQRFDHPAA